MYSYGTSVLFLCRQCKDSFQTVDDLIEHKKEEHFVEFRTSNCIVFEDVLILNTSNDRDENCGMLSTVKEKGNPVPSLKVPLVGIQTNLTDVDLSHSPKQIPHDPADAFQFRMSTSNYQNDDYHENFSYHDDNETCNNFLPPNHDENTAYDLQPASPDISLIFIEPKTELTELENDQKINRTTIDALTQGPRNPYVILQKLSSNELQNYFRLQNQDTVQSTAKVTSDFRCKLCLGKFNSEAELETHCRVCTLDSDRQDRYCFPCKKLFKSKWTLNVHKIRAHGTEEEKRKLFSFKCNVCQKVYTKKISLTHHMESHKERDEQNKPFKCNQCGASFFTKYYLKRHESSHSLARPFECPQLSCDRAYKHNDHLQHHFRVAHSKRGKSFDCPE